MTTNPPPIIDVAAEAEAGASALIDSLGHLAYENKPSKEVLSKKYKSRFFFRITPSSVQEARIRAKKMRVKKKLEHVDSEIEGRLTEYRKEAPPALAKNIERVREFFLKEIGLCSFAGSAGTAQAHEVAQRLLNSVVDTTQFDKFDRMSNAAIAIKMSKFVAKYYGLQEKDALRILSMVIPKAPTTIRVPESFHENSKTEIEKK